MRAEAGCVHSMEVTLQQMITTELSGNTAKEKEISG